MTDITFARYQPPTTDLAFGADTPVVTYADAAMVGNLPGTIFGFSASPGLDNAVSRGVSASANLKWEGAASVGALTSTPVEKPKRTEANATNPVLPANGVSAAHRSAWGGLVNKSETESTLWQDAKHFGDMQRSKWSGLIGTPVSRRNIDTGFEAAKRRGVLQDDLWAVLKRNNRPEFDLEAGAARPILVVVIEDYARAGHLNGVLGFPWQDTRPPAAGKSPHNTGGEPQPGPEKYVPITSLAFSRRQPASTELVFGTKAAPAVISIPVKRTYIVVNEVHLRTRSGTELPCYSINMSLDRNSWTWGFSASLHASALSLIEPAAYGEPVELEVLAGGKSYYFLAEGISRDRAFASTRINVTGRGRSALLSEPYSSIQTFANDTPRTAQQLMVDVLTENGVSLGWEIDFGLTDWTVPAGAFSHTGSYMSAVTAIAAAAGGYIQSDPVLDTLAVKPIYPSVPWGWGSVTPDIELPASVTSRESISWADRPAYNGVYVSGSGVGVLALVKKTGTAGNLLAPMVVDPLITGAEAARQRGISLLGDTGRIATVSISLPVLPETGIIHPGKMIRYVDGGVSRVGISRAVQFSFTNPTARQIVEIETHV